MAEKVQRIKSINGRDKIDRKRLRIIWGRGEAKELTCMTHGQELRWWNDGGWMCRVEGNKGEKKMGQL